MGFIFPYKSKVISILNINHDVILLRITKPYKYIFKIGQAVDMSIDKPGYELSVSSFTLSNVPDDDYLEFIIKVYPRKNGLSKGIAQLVPNDTIQLSNAWDVYTYNGCGTFIAAGTGITPFLPIFKEMEDKGIDIKKHHSLIYANKTKDDILFYKKLKQLFHSKLLIFLSRTKYKNFYFGKVNQEYLSEFISISEQKFYICGPMHFEIDIKSFLINLGVKKDNIQTGYQF
ncbi:hypothetical protein C5O00_00545 [Pukyongia salina]|uniref:FAD-binding FR-type domain-containing protein n=1 Tax=Pukyongia salina TaxID=2094025 RepID=A0A2S0HST4_9FLAO|nr:FAD-binding oxidoreductase [Pukyongia salina]AVI49730.1 hypothetical protein C5O00_00545 [Pukyongia salina]